MKHSKLYRKVSTKGLADEPRVAAQPSYIRFLWRTHLQGCLRKGVGNEIAVEEYAALVRANCWHCDGVPYLRKAPKGVPPFTANGVDRLNNDLPYTAANSVACCKWCNAMKSGLGLAEFRAHVLRLADAIKAQTA